jgi:exoribonuclease R
MKKEFLKKIIKAERLKYEAVKEILPEGARKRVDHLEKSAANLLKEVVFELMQEERESHKESAKEKTKKVEVDFS